MDDARDPVNRVSDAVCDGLRHLGNVSYAILPKDIAHALGDLKKALLSQVREAVDIELSWIDDRVAEGDKLREEWKQKCAHDAASDATS
jgi:hypothetical protein